jgi:hypothetical protein
MLRGEIDWRINGRYSNSLDALFLDLGTYSSYLVRVDLKSARLWISASETGLTWEISFPST